VTDIIESVGAQPVGSLEEWRAHAGRLGVGETIVLGVRRRGEIEQVEVTAVAPPAPPPRETLGVTLRSRPGEGAEVIAVEAGSVAEAAGILAGDLITSLAGGDPPSPQQIIGTFRELPPGEAVLAAVSRGEEHLVVALVKP
jgi:S1-C subfamily serine protease